MPREPFHRLFFAVRPPVAVIPEIAALRDSFGQTRNLVADDRFHLTTWLFDDSQDFPADIAAGAQAAVETMPFTAFRIVLDRRLGSGSHLLLLPSEPLQGFVAFHARLDRALREQGLAPRGQWRFAPHLTLLHGRHDIDEPIDAVSWTASELVLIDSIVGQRRHDVISRWALE